MVYGLMFAAVYLRHMFVCPLSASTSASSCADPACSIWREPRRVYHTICTAIVPEAAFTARTYVTRSTLRAEHQSAHFGSTSTERTQIRDAWTIAENMSSVGVNHQRDTPPSSRFSKSSSPDSVARLEVVDTFSIPLTSCR